MSSSTRHLQLNIQLDDILNGVKKVLLEIRPTWDLADVSFKVFTEGISNQLMGCFHPSEPHGLLVRIYGAGTELFIDRENELRTMKALASAQQGPELIASFENGLVYHYIPGSVLTVENVTNPKLWPLVAKRLGAMHKLPASASSVLWDRIEKFYLLVSENVFRDEKYSTLRTMFSKKETLKFELQWMKHHLRETTSPVVFCHNDLLLANVVVSPDNDNVTFIDYEYAGSNFQAFDIANHFNEYAGVDDIDFNRIPDESYQKEWIRIYLTSYQGKEPSDDDLELTATQVKQFLAASHFHWAIWSLVQSLHSKIEFDFNAYAVTKFQFYFRVKNLVTES